MSEPMHSKATLEASTWMVFRFELVGEKWNWPVAGDDSIRAFRELLHLAQVPYVVERQER